MADPGRQLSHLSPERRLLVERALAARSATPSYSGRPLKVSVFFFSADLEAAAGDAVYDLFRDVVDVAEAERLHAVWVPERHFHRFGGPYPNPAVLAAAAAARTSRIAIRAGSVVLPLHDPLTIAEQWACVDQLSGGRAGVAIASGWNPGDFVLRPQAYADRKHALGDQIEELRRLWRGDAVSRRGPDGSMIDVRTLPRPVRSTIPLWLTSSSSPQTWVLAAATGANVLTALLEQSLDEVAERIALYRVELASHGHNPDEHEVTLMLHCYVGADDQETAAAVREPLAAYLREHMGFYTEYARQRGLDPDSVSEEDRQAMIGFAVDRYLQSNGFFGNVDACVKRAHELADVGVTEIAGLVDFGVENHLVVRSVARLGEVARRLGR